MKAYTTLMVLMLVAGASAVVLEADEPVVCGSENYVDMDVSGVDTVLLQTLPNTIVKQDFSLGAPTLRVYDHGSIDDVLMTSVEDGTLMVASKNGQQDVCVHLLLNGKTDLSTIIVNDEANATFSGNFMLDTMTLQIISGNFFAPNTSQITIDLFNFNATGQGEGTFLHELNAVSEAVISLGGNSNLTFLGGVGSGSVSVAGQGNVILGPVLSNIDVSLTGLGNLITDGSATAMFVGEATMPNTVQYQQGSCEVTGGDGAAPDFFPCKALVALQETTAQMSLAGK